MKPKLVPDWREVVSHSFAFWLNTAGVLILMLDTVGYATGWLELDPYWVGFTVLGLLIGAMALRLVRQDRRRWIERLKVIVVVMLACLLGLLMVPRAFGATPDPLVARLTLGVDRPFSAPATQDRIMAIAKPFVARNEGLRLSAYRPFSWDRPTICYGETHGVRMGMTATRAECEAMLQRRLEIEWRDLAPHFNDDAHAKLLSPVVAVSFLDLAHNCGVPTIGGSTAVRRLNRGDRPGACEAQTWWNKGGKRVIIGLVKRRSDDYTLCMADG